MMGVEKCEQVIVGVGDVVCQLIDAAKKGAFGMPFLRIFRIFSILEVIDLVREIVEVVRDMPGALPELRDLDRQEIEKLSGVAYETVKRIIAVARG